MHECSKMSTPEQQQQQQRADEPANSTSGSLVVQRASAPDGSSPSPRQLESQTLRGTSLGEEDSSDVTTSPDAGFSTKEFEANEETEPGEVDDAVPGSKNDPFRFYRFSKQTLVVLVWVCLGLYAEIIGPTMPDLKDRLGVNYEELSKGLVGKSIGMLVGSVVGGFIHERFYRKTDLLVVMGLLVAAAATIAIPFTPQLGVVVFLFSLCGVAEGILNTGVNTMVMHLWGENTAAPMHSLHFGFGLGALLAPQIARPFLSAEALGTEEDSDGESYNWTTTSSLNQTSATSYGVSRIEIPYTIIGVVIIGFSIVLVLFYLRGPPKGMKMYKPHTDFKAMINPASCGHGFVFYGVELFVCLFIYFLQAVGGQRGFGNFLFSFAIESDLQLSKPEAANLQTGFWACFTAGRMLGIPISYCVPMPYILLGDVVGLTVLSCILAIFASRVALALWIGSCLLGAFIGVMFPNGMAWANVYLKMNSIGVMILMVGGSCGGFVYQYLTGYLFQRDPRNLMYIMVGFAVVTAVVSAIMQALATVHGRKILKTRRISDLSVYKEPELSNTEHLKSKDESSHL